MFVVCCHDFILSLAVGSGFCVVVMPVIEVIDVINSDTLCLALPDMPSPSMIMIRPIMTSFFDLRIDIMNSPPSNARYDDLE